MLKYEIANIRNQAETCETCVSMKREGKDLHETLSKFTSGKKPRFDSIKSNVFLE